MSKIRTNETHICVLKVKNERLNTELLKLPIYFKYEIAELELQVKNSNKTLFDLYTFIEQSELFKLCSHYDFCKEIKKPYQGIRKLKFPNYMEFRKAQEEKKSIIASKNKNTPVQEIELKYRNNEQLEKEELFEQIKLRQLAFSMDKSYSSLKKDKDIIAYSHRRIGWSNPRYEVNKNFGILFKTNFGYGYSSYFFLIIKYKNIDIVPYSDWISYRLVSSYDIIRYTRRFQLEHSSWVQAMDFAKELYHLSIDDPQKLVNNWIINECREMVGGLKLLASKRKEFELNRSFFSETKDIIKGIALIDFRGERISGALIFLERIKELATLSSEIPDFVNDILQYNESIFWELKEEKQGLKKKLKTESRSRRLKYIEKEPLDRSLDKLLKIKNQEFQVYLSKDNLDDTTKNQIEFDGIYDKENPIIKETKLKVTELNTEIYLLDSKIKTLNNYITKFGEYIHTIEQHFGEKESRSIMQRA